MIIGIFPILNYVEAVPPKDLPDVSAAPWKVRVIVTNELRAEVRPLYTTFGNPALYLTPPGGVYDGVGDLILTIDHDDFGVIAVRCSGALLTSGIQVLTAAHCVTDGDGDLILQSGYITFEGDITDFPIDVLASATKVHPNWDGDILRGNDVAVLELVSAAPDEITRYDIDRNGDDDVNAIGDKAGYGRSGNGDDGDILDSGIKRDGENKYDDVADTMLKALKFRPNKDFVPGSVLQYDFDNGLSQNDAFGFFFNKRDLGVGPTEVNSAPGDSGGPTFTNGVITGITSYGIRLSNIFGSSPDVDGELNSSFGEYSGDTRVSKYASFIDGVLLTTPPSDTMPPETSIDSATDGSGVAVTNGGTTSSTSITFTFSGTDNVAVASFECSFDAAVFSACTSPQIFSGLSVVSHAFQVRAIDTAGITDPTPASWSWTVVSTPLTDVIDITKAQFNTRNGQLRVEATYTDPSVDLTVEGYGLMDNNGDGTYSLRVRGVEDPGATITVTSPSGAFDTAEVRHK